MLGRKSWGYLALDFEIGSKTYLGVGELSMQAITLHAKNNIGFSKEEAKAIMVYSFSSLSSIYYHIIWREGVIILCGMGGGYHTWAYLSFIQRKKPCNNMQPKDYIL